MPDQWVYDSLGSRRRIAPYAPISQPAIDVVAQVFQGSRLFIQPPDFAKERDSEIWKKLRRDEVIAAKAEMRQKLVASVSWYLEPGDQRSKALVPYFRALIEMIPNFASARMAQTAAIFEGLSWMRMLTPPGDRNVQLPGDIAPRKWWWPELSHVDADKIRRFPDREAMNRKFVDSDGKDMPAPQRWYWGTLDAVQNRWLRVENLRDYIRVSYHDDAHTLGHGHGLCHALWKPFSIKTHLERMMIQGARRYAFPWIGVQMEEEANFGDSATGSSAYMSPEERRDELLAELEKTQESHNAVFVWGKGAKINALDFSGQGAEGLLALIRHYNDTMTEYILGSSMPTGGGGDSGSLARAAVEAGTTTTYVSHDRAIFDESWTRDLIGALWRFNRHNFAQIVDPETGLLLGDMRPPRFRTGREKSDDHDRNVQRMSAFVQTFPGLPLSADQVYELAGFEQPGPDDMPAMGAVAMQMQQAQMQAEAQAAADVSGQDVPLQDGGEVDEGQVDDFAGGGGFAELDEDAALFAHLARPSLSLVEDDEAA